MKFLKLSLATSFMVAANLASAAVLYDLPFKGEDFPDSQKLHTRDHTETATQKYGYDIGALRFDSNDGWIGRLGSKADYDKNPTNDKFVIYKKPVYAMRSGTVIACWRNAPENPRPKLSTDTTTGKEWLHPKFKAGLIPGGGNMLVVEHDDGTQMLYAHMVTGSISSNLCPKSAATYSRKVDSAKGESPMDIEFTGLTPGQQVKVAKGQLLGLVGNSGSSSGPHLHIHLTRYGYAEEIFFAKGISSPVDNKSRYGTWTSFAGGKIPNGERLLWAPRTVSGGYVRNNFAAAGFQALFQHLADSGYRPTWLDGYRVGNANYYNMVWKPASGVKWRLYTGISSSTFKSTVEKNESEGYIPVHVDSHQVASGAAHSLIVEKRVGNYLAIPDLNEVQHNFFSDHAKKLNLTPTSISVISINGERRYTVLYRSENIGTYVANSKIPSADYQNYFNTQTKAGKKPLYLNSYYHDGKVYFTAVFSTLPNNQIKGTHSVTSATFQSLFNEYGSQGYSTALVAGVDGYSAHRFSAVWRK